MLSYTSTILRLPAKRLSRRSMLTYMQASLTHPRGGCEAQISKNTQAYFGDRRMLRTGFVFDESLRTPTYSTKFHTQEYRSGHNEAVLKTRA